MVNIFKAGKGQKRESSAYKHEKSKKPLKRRSITKRFQTVNKA
jgi:hypothetical protein